MPDRATSIRVDTVLCDPKHHAEARRIAELAEARARRHDLHGDGLIEEMHPGSTNPDPAFSDIHARCRSGELGRIRIRLRARDPSTRSMLEWMETLYVMSSTLDEQLSDWADLIVEALKNPKRADATSGPYIRLLGR
jgi:hypothetical protein